MKYALIGCGRISPNHIEAAKNNNLDFVAMCDIIPEVMQEKSDRFGLETVRKYTDYKELLEKNFYMIDPDWRTNPDIKWNFTKFLIDREGKVIARFEPTEDMKNVEKAVAELI